MSKSRIRADMLNGWEDVEGIVHCQGLSCVSEVIQIELTSHFGIKKSSRHGIQINAPRQAEPSVALMSIDLPVGKTYQWICDG